MQPIIATASAWHGRLASLTGQLDGVASLLLRLILAPVLIYAGWEKITGANWFGSALEGFPFPFNVLPAELSWFLASWTEFLGGILLLFGLGTRLVAIPLAVTMFVAPGPIELVQANARSRLLIRANPIAVCTAACSLRLR